MKKLLPKRKPERKPSEEDFTVRKSKYATQQLKYTTLMVKENFALKLPKKLLVKCLGEFHCLMMCL